MEFKVKVSGPGIEYSAEVSKEIAANVVSMCLKGDAILPVPLRPTPILANLESVAEYVHAKGPTRNPDKILAIAGYLVKNGGETFSPEELKSYFPKIGEPVPANFGRDFRWAVANGWIAESPEGKNLYYVTNSGKAVLDSNFAPEVTSKTKQKNRLRSSKKRGNGDQE